MADIFFYDDFEDGEKASEWSEWGGAVGGGGTEVEQNGRWEFTIPKKAGPPTQEYYGFYWNAHEEGKDKFDVYGKLELNTGLCANGTTSHDWRFQLLDNNGYFRIILYADITNYQVRYSAYDGTNNDNQVLVTNISNEYIWVRVKWEPSLGDTVIKSYYSETEPTSDDDWTEISYATASPSISSVTEATQAGMGWINSDTVTNHIFYTYEWLEWFPVSNFTFNKVNLSRLVVK